MRILWSRVVKSRCLVRNTDFPVVMQEKPRPHTAVLPLILIIVSRKTVTPLISLPYGKKSLCTHQIFVSA